jgi:phosphoribosyl 1,2-cyclic phosphate phosphodiesterase
MKLRILGCGTSSGVPRIGGDWGECDPAEPKNRRLRVSILVEHEGSSILVDTGPDLREQLIAAGTTSLDAVVWTHDHADHCHGIDDLRQIYHLRGTPIPAFAREETLATLIDRFGYVFQGRGGYPAIAEAHLLSDHFRVGSIDVRVADQPHGQVHSAGLLFEAGGKKIGYSTDFNEMTEAMEALFKGIDVWVVDALRRRPHPTHPHLDQCLDWIRALQPRRAILTHMDQSMDYRSLCRELPETVEPGYDGMEISL